MKYRLWIQEDKNQFSSIYIDIEQDIYQFLAKALFDHFDDMNRYKELALFIYDIHNFVIADFMDEKDPYGEEDNNEDYNDSIYHKDVTQEELRRNLQIFTSFGLNEEELVKRMKEVVFFEEVVFNTY